MWKNCGVVRTEKAMLQGLAKIHEMQAMLADVDVRPNAEGYKDLAIALDLRASLVVAEATILSAMQRRESRGAHQRYDFPELDPKMRVNFRVRLDEEDKLQVESVPVPAVPAELVQWTQEEEELSLKGRLLE